MIKMAPEGSKALTGPPSTSLTCMRKARMERLAAGKGRKTPAVRPVHVPDKMRWQPGKTGLISPAAGA